MGIYCATHLKRLYATGVCEMYFQRVTRFSSSSRMLVKLRGHVVSVKVMWLFDSWCDFREVAWPCSDVTFGGMMWLRAGARRFNCFVFATGIALDMNYGKPQKIFSHSSQHIIDDVSPYFPGFQRFLGIFRAFYKLVTAGGILTGPPGPPFSTSASPCRQRDCDPAPYACFQHDLLQCWCKTCLSSTIWKEVVVESRTSLLRLWGCDRASAVSVKDDLSNSICIKCRHCAAQLWTIEMFICSICI